MCQEFGKDMELQKLKLAQMLLEGSLSQSDKVEDTYFLWLNSWSQVNSVQLREGGVYPQGSKTWVCAGRKKKKAQTWSLLVALQKLTLSNILYY